MSRQHGRRNLSRLRSGWNLPGRSEAAPATRKVKGSSRYIAKLRLQAYAAVAGRFTARA
ncbi:hypothetical protein [Jiangella anatolica]|uniref:hypothetical protein n=1 Tax=Jiangella anatolica TaxID=2670374 RepID=UPI001313FF58|nr:hypothetical protein [Jiangella anatolica]